MLLNINLLSRHIGAAALYVLLNLFLAPGASANDGGTLKGVVSDKNGPLVGVAVYVKDTNNGVSSDIDGNYLLAGLEEGDVIVFSLLGFDTVEITWTGQALQDVVLDASADFLDEVVVVGYGVQKKVNLTGSVSTVDSDELDMRPVANITQSLQGLVPGLTVNNTNSGRPGAEATLQIRGQGNLSGTSTPYVLVDGVEMDLADVNPNDVESISVLKDASASAIYGARAAYGVILVTTKSGEKGKIRVSYNGNAGWTQPTVRPDMANSVEYANYWNAAAANAGSSRLYSAEKIAQLQAFINDPSSVDPWSDPYTTLNAAYENSEYGVGNTDYFDLHYKDFAFKQDHNLSVSGGSDKVRYYVSGGAYTEEGILRYADIDYARYNIAANINADLTKWMRLKFNTKYSHQETNTPFGTGGLSEGFYHSLARFSPTKHYIDPNGNFTELSLIPYLQSGTYTNSVDDDFLFTVGLEVEPVKNWKIFADYTYKQNNWNYKALNKAPVMYEADGVTTFTGTRSEMGVLADGSFLRQMDIIRYQTLNVYTTYSHSVDKHNFTVMAGFQEEDYNYNYMYGYVTDLASYTNTGLNLGMGDDTLTESRYGWATSGFFGRLNYDYDGRYLVEFSARYDGSSRFAKGNRWGFFPSVSVGWNIAREPFFEPASHIFDELKIRASWGRLGNQAGADYYTFSSTMSTTAQGNWYFEDGRDMYINAPGVIDSDTTWEKVDSKNIALDWTLLKGRVTGSLEFYQRDTYDMLGPSEELPDFFGADAPETNNASMRNRGWELSLLYRGQIAKKVDFSIGGSVYDATAVVTEYSNPTGTDPSGNWYTGREVGEIWGYRASGLIQTQEEADAYNNSLDLSYLTTVPWTPGDVKYLDINGDGKIDNGSNTLGDMGDMEVIGSTTPRYNYTIQGSLAWKGITLSVMFQGVGKRDWAPDGVYFWGCSSYAQMTVFKEHLDYWSETNTDAYYPKPYTQAAGTVGQYTAKTQQTCDLYLQSAAYCRLKNLTLSYDFPQKLISKIGLTKLQVYFSGDNLVTFTKLASMFDPEGVFTSSDYTSEAGKNYPMNRIYSVGLIVNL